MCKWHGGRAPQVIASAQARLMALQHPAIGRIEKLIASEEFPSVAYQASKDVLDRTMGRAVESVDLRVGLDEQLLTAALIAGRARAKSEKD